MLYDLGFFEGDAVWPPEGEAWRLDQNRANQQLFDGSHAQVFQQWYRLLRQDEAAALEIILNWPKRLSTLWADLVVGEPPTFSVGEKGGPAQARLDDLLDEAKYTSALYEGLIDLSRYGVTVFKTCLRDGHAYTEVIAPYYWFPVTEPGNIRNVTQHVIAYTYDQIEGAGTKNEKRIEYLKVEIHTKGQIEHRLYKLGDGVIQAELGPDDLRIAFPQLDNGDINDENRVVEQTGVDDFLVQYVTSLRGSDRLFGHDDYRDLEGVLQEFEVRLSQISRVLDEHADPNMYGPADAVTVDPITGEGIFEGGGKFFPTEDSQVTPGYITWEGQLAASFHEMEVLMEQFYLISETSPAAFGKMDAGLAPSGTALRRLMLAPLAKASRIRMALDPVARKNVELMGALEDANGSGGASLAGVDATWNDGLPKDENEQTQIWSIRVSGGFGSRFSAIKAIDGVDDDQAQAEMDRIKKEEAEIAALAAQAMASQQQGQQGAGQQGSAIPGTKTATAPQPPGDVKNTTATKGYTPLRGVLERFGHKGGGGGGGTPAGGGTSDTASTSTSITSS